MKTRWKKTVAVVGIAAMLAASAFRSGTTYAQDETGTVMRVEQAQVVSSREVVIAGLDNKQAAGWGTVVGATIAGAAAYGITEADNPAGVAITIIAAVVGGLAGLAAEERRETRPGAEYILRDDSGKTFAVLGGRRGDLSARHRRLPDPWLAAAMSGSYRRSTRSSVSFGSACPSDGSIFEV